MAAPLPHGRKFNFSAGPSALPLEALEEAQKELLNYHGCGYSVCEMSHRSKEFEAINKESMDDLRELLNIPNNYKILFLGAGATAEFAGVPLNLGCVGDDKVADYIESGQWSNKALKEAKNFCKVNVAGCSAKDGQYASAPAPETWKLSENSEYVYYCDNETVHGVQYHCTPEVPANKVLVCDMSSSFLSKPVDVAKYGVIYAGAQKNAGPAGVTIVIVREDLLVKGKAHKHTPSALNWQQQAANDSMLNTPPCFPWYLTGLTFKWLKKNGGVAGMQKHHDYMASQIYQVLDDTPFYRGFVAKEYRSNINVPFTFSFKDVELEATFLAEAKKRNLVNLKGYKTMGGFRASMYNAMPKEGAEELAKFMREFAATHADKMPK